MIFESTLSHKELLTCGIACYRTYVVNSISVNSFKTNIDKCWCSQDVYYDYQCDTAGTGNQSVSNKWFSQYTD